MFPEIARDDVFRIETQRLWLRWPRLADSPAITRFASLKAVAEMTTRVPHPYPKGAAEAFVLQIRQSNTDGQSLQFVISPLARPAEVIGIIGLYQRNGADLSVGYMLDPAAWGKGIATEASQAVLDMVFGVTSAKIVRASVRLINPASRRVLEKCGFVFEGSGLNDAPARGGPMPVDFFRLDRSTWLSLKGWREPRFGRDAGIAPATLATVAGTVA